MLGGLRRRGADAAGKSPALDNVTPDLVKHLPNWTLVLLRALFEDRINQRRTTTPEMWKRLLVNCIPKQGEDLTWVKGWRPITLAPCLQKFYGAVLSRLVGAHGLPLPSHVVGFHV